MTRDLFNIPVLSTPTHLAEKTDSLEGQGAQQNRNKFEKNIREGRPSLLGAKDIATRNKQGSLRGAPGIATRSMDAIRSKGHRCPRLQDLNLLLVAFLFLIAMPLFLVVRMLLVAMPFAPNGVHAASSDARSP